MKKILTLFLCVISLCACLVCLTACFSDPLEGTFFTKAYDKIHEYWDGVVAEEDYPAMTITKSKDGESYQVTYTRYYFDTKNNKPSGQIKQSVGPFIVLTKSDSENNLYVGESHYNLFFDYTDNISQYIFRINGDTLTVSCTDGDSNKITTYELKRTNMKTVVDFYTYLENEYTK